MKNICFLILILMLFHITGSKAQTPWTRLSANPQENTLNCVRKIPGTNKLVAVGEGSTVMISEDEGETWQLILNPAGMDNEYGCKGVCFIDETTGFINGKRETILKTTDGGNTWEMKHVDSTIYEYQCVNDIKFVNDLTGFAAGGDGHLLKTTDAGETWLIQPESATFDLLQIEFAGSLTGYIIGTSDSFILKTVDGGNAWSLISFPAGLPHSDLSDIHFVSDSVGFIAGVISDQTYLYKTTDMGENWTQVYTTWQMPYGGDFVFFDGLSGFYALPTVVNYATMIISTNDGGNTWTENWPELGINDANSLCAFDENIAYSVGGYGAIHKSTNRGMNWEQKDTRIFHGNVYDTQFLDQNVGYALSDIDGEAVGRSTLMKTIDGGLTWNRIDQMYFYGGAFYFLDSDSGFFATYDGGMTLFMTTDGGNNWTEMPIGFNFEPKLVKFYDHNNGIIIGSQHMIKTRDGGATWQIDNVTAIYDFIVEDIEYRSADKIFAVGISWLENSILTTDDGGISWETISINEFREAFDICFIDDNTAFLACLNAILKSTDGGNTWATVTTNNPNWMYIGSICFPSQEVGYAVGNGKFENMLKTTDGGDTWNPVVTNVSSGLNSVWFSDNDNGLVFGEGGVLLKTTSGGITEVNENAVAPNENLFEVYPNPVSGTVNIRLNPGREHKGAEIIITDRIGREINSIRLKSGTASLKFAMDMYSSGIYFFQYVAAHGIIESKKVIVR